MSGRITSMGTGLVLSATQLQSAPHSVDYMTNSVKPQDKNGSLWAFPSGPGALALALQPHRRQIGQDYEEGAPFSSHVFIAVQREVIIFKIKLDFKYSQGRFGQMRLATAQRRRWYRWLILECLPSLVSFLLVEY